MLNIIPHVFFIPSYILVSLADHQLFPPSVLKLFSVTADTVSDFDTVVAGVTVLFEHVRV